MRWRVRCSTRSCSPSVSTNAFEGVVYIKNDREGSASAALREITHGVDCLTACIAAFRKLKVVMC